MSIYISLRTRRITKIFSSVLVMTFGLQACGGGDRPSTTSSEPTQAIVDQAKNSPNLGGIGGTNYGAQSTTTPSTATSTPPASSNNDENKDLKSMYWLLGTVGLMAVAVGIAYLVTGGDGMFGNPPKKEAAKKDPAPQQKNSTSEPQPQELKSVIKVEPAEAPVPANEAPAAPTEEKPAAVTPEPSNASGPTSTQACAKNSSSGLSDAKKIITHAE